MRSTQWCSSQEGSLSNGIQVACHRARELDALEPDALEPDPIALVHPFDLAGMSCKPGEVMTIASRRGTVA
jgi:hypothetical protein